MTSKTPESPTSAPRERDRFCLACGYNLRGLGYEPRCPECGLLNIPEGLRRQVWDLVDGGKWFFAGIFHPFEKRLPGWWWSLDREGDVRRSYRFLAKNVLIAALITLSACWVAEACMFKVTQRIASYGKDDPTGVPLAEKSRGWLLGIGMRHLDPIEDENTVYLHDLYQPQRIVKVAYSTELTFIPSWNGLVFGGLPLLALLIVWAGPAYVGIQTQFRKGLPDFARAPRTFAAAANYESFRLVYLSILIVACLGIEFWIRSTLNQIPYPNTSSMLMYGLGVVLPPLAALLFGAAGWVGPLRSDYTRQLIRSRLHAARIIIMYAVILPLITVFTINLFRISL